MERSPIVGATSNLTQTHRVREALARAVGALRGHSRYNGDMTYVAILKKGQDF